MYIICILFFIKNFFNILQEKNQWNYHEGYYISPFNNWNKNYKFKEAKKYRLEVNRRQNLERPIFDNLMEFEDEKRSFKSFLKYVFYNYYATSEFNKRMDSIFNMIQKELEWDTLLEPLFDSVSTLEKRDDKMQNLKKIKNWV